MPTLDASRADAVTFDSYGTLVDTGAAVRVLDGVVDDPAAVDEYGPDRIMVDTDCANVLRTGPFSIKRAMLELSRLGVDVGDIRQIVQTSPREVLGVAD